MSKKNLLIVGYYHLADGFKTCANYLQTVYDVYFFPLCHYIDSKYDAVSELITYINGNRCDHYECGLRENNPQMNIVLLWNFKYLQNFMSVIKGSINHRTTFIGYNWDPISPVIDIEEDKKNFIRLLNGYMTCDGREMRYLWNCCIYNCVYCPPGFDPHITHFIYDPSYECDVSIVCTNLYTDYTIFPKDHVTVHRKDLIDLLYESRKDIKFHIYGPKDIGEQYPECYKGYVTYGDCPKVFANSKINLCIHATSYNNEKNYLYFSERLPQIMGAHGLVYCETKYDTLLLPNINYILADEKDPVGQIKRILKSNDYRTIRDKGHELALKSLTWGNMLDKISVICGYTI